MNNATEKKGAWQQLVDESENIEQMLAHAKEEARRNMRKAGRWDCQQCNTVNRPGSCFCRNCGTRRTD